MFKLMDKRIFSVFTLKIHLSGPMGISINSMPYGWEFPRLLATVSIQFICIFFICCFL